MSGRRVVRNLVGSRPAQKALEVRTPLVQNGADEHGPDRGDIAVEWAHFGRLNGDIGNYPGAAGRG